MTEETGSDIWRRLRSWLLGSSFGAAAMLLPAAAHAKEHHRTDRAVHHIGRTYHHVERVASRHTDVHGRDIHGRDVHVVRTAYRTDRSHNRELHEYGRHAQFVRADYRYGHSHHYAHGRRVVPHFSYSRLQCVPYAREVSHINLSGDAFLWWAEAAGRYGRGHLPVVGSVLNFRSTGRMPLGHVAVVTAILNTRTILVTQANWIPGTITNDVTVEDVSPENNWSAVRVEYDNTNAMGSSAYPTYGFIYNRPAGAQTIYASNAGGRNEVAEAPAVRPIAAEAPNRNLR